LTSTYQPSNLGCRCKIHQRYDQAIITAKNIRQQVKTRE